MVAHVGDASHELREPPSDELLRHALHLATLAASQAADIAQSERNRSLALAASQRRSLQELQVSMCGVVVEPFAGQYSCTRLWE